MYRLLPLPSIFTLDEVHLAYVLMGRSHEVEEALLCCESAQAKVPEGTYYVDFAEERDAIVRVFTESLFSPEVVVTKNYMGAEAAQQMFEFFGCESVGLLAVAAFVSEDAPWKDFCKLVDRMAKGGAMGMVLCVAGDAAITTCDSDVIEEGLEEGQVRDRLLYICEFFQERQELST